MAWCFMTRAAPIFVQAFDRFGLLTAIRRAPHPRTKWLCKCDCGNETIAFANMIKDIVGNEINIIPAPYEPGEMIDGKPIDFKSDNSYTIKLLGCEPKFDLDTALIKTMYWFKKNLNRYSVR